MEERQASGAMDQQTLLPKLRRWRKPTGSCPSRSATRRCPGGREHRQPHWWAGQGEQEEPEARDRALLRRPLPEQRTRAATTFGRYPRLDEPGACRCRFRSEPLRYFHTPSATCATVAEVAPLGRAVEKVHEYVLIRDVATKGADRETIVDRNEVRRSIEHNG